MQKHWLTVTTLFGEHPGVQDVPVIPPRVMMVGVEVVCGDGRKTPVSSHPSTPTPHTAGRRVWSQSKFCLPFRSMDQFEKNAFSANTQSRFVPVAFHCILGHLRLASWSLHLGSSGSNVQGKIKCPKRAACKLRKPSKGPIQVICSCEKQKRTVFSPIRVSIICPPGKSMI